MSPNKTISINPSLFSIGKTRKKQTSGPKPPKIVPIISPNNLKKKLLGRIKEHKQKEIQNKTTNPSNPSKSDQPTDFNNEFNESIEYLQSLTTQKKETENKIRQRNALERRTVKNHFAMHQDHPTVNIELPTELQLVEPVLPNETTIPNHPTVPYGILKGGTKPTYRQWAKTQRNNEVVDPNASLIVNRENRLNMIKEKIRQKHVAIPVTATPVATPIVSTPMNVVTPVITPVVTPVVDNTKVVAHTNVTAHTPVVEPGKVLVGTKHITKKTIKRKYSLGRSNIKRKVAVLIKDNGTRKKVIMAQKDLKRKNINDIKDYLKKHNLWSTGSNTPNDVLRQMYESAMLAGEITNNNTETLLHNLAKE